jgi:hypothetical protein
MMWFIGGGAVLILLVVFAVLRDQYQETELEYDLYRASRVARIEDAAAWLTEELGREPTVAEIYDATWGLDDEATADAAVDPYDETDEVDEPAAPTAGPSPNPSEAYLAAVARLDAVGERLAAMKAALEDPRR